ncbi:MAG: ATP-binding protein, partial [Cyanobacteria bacterium P01_G01_bin.19]
WQQVASKAEYQQSLGSQFDLILYHAGSMNLSLREVIDLLLVNNLDIPVIVINDTASISQAVAAIKTGATDYIPATELERLPTAVTQALAEPNTCFHVAQCTAQTEQQLQQLITDNADGIIVVNKRGKVEFVNPAALELFAKSEAELIGEPLGFPVVDGDYVEVDLPQTSGQDLVAQMRVSHIRWQGKNAYILSLRDITQIKQAEAERAKLLEESQAANRAKDQFLAILSHELRTPLNPIVGWSQLLQTGTLSEAQMKKGADIIQRNAMLQSQLIEDILDISRIIRGKIELQAAPIKLSNIISNAIDTIKLSAQAKSIQINTDFSNHKDLVWGDSTRLQQVIWNLLTNAIKFTPNGGRVEINLTSVNNTVQVQIKDTGKGIEPEFLPHIFDYFRQAENVNTRAQGGLGLGLAIVRHLVELHGGTIGVDSPGVGQGATFTFALPVLNARNKLGSTNSPLPTTKNLEGIKALVVDDDDSSRDLLIFVLENEGVTTKSAASAIEALRVIEQFQPDILVSDIAMPGMDGYELMQRVKELPTMQKEQPNAIALSAYASDTDRERSLASGFDCHINKPLDISNFLQILTQLLD